MAKYKIELRRKGAPGSTFHETDAIVCGNEFITFVPADGHLRLFHLVELELLIITLIGN